MVSIYNLSLEELKENLVSQGLKPYRAKQIFSWIYKKRVQKFSSMTNFSEKQKKALEKSLFFLSPIILKEELSKDGTKKLLLELADRSTIETALIPEKQRNTLCVSTQVGCKFNCCFCRSKEGGFVRDLRAGEIVSQYLLAAKKDKITNIVYMGVGEPLDNFENTIKSIKILTEPSGVNFTKRRISLSTCGLPEPIRGLADLDLGIKLSVSLHSLDNDKRSQLMPINKKYPLNRLLKAIEYYQKKQAYPVTFEYILIEGVNMSDYEAKELARMTKKIGAKLNLIPCNSEESKRPSFIDSLVSFQKYLAKEKVVFTLRKPRGSDINAACGQLRSLSLGERYEESFK